MHIFACYFSIIAIKWRLLYYVVENEGIARKAAGRVGGRKEQRTCHIYPSCFPLILFSFFLLATPVILMLLTFKACIVLTMFY